MCKKERNATADVRALLMRFEKQKLRGVIIDLRGNGGGLLSHARDITGLLIETGPVVQTLVVEPNPRHSSFAEFTGLSQSGELTAR